MNSSASIFTAWPNEGLEEVPACPLCGSQNSSLAYGGLRDYFFACAPGAWSLYQCASCRSGYLNPRPTQETIGRAYSEYYTHQSNQSAASGLRKLWHALRNDYLLSRFGFKSAHVMWPGRWLIRLLPIWRQGLDSVLARNLEPLPPGGGSLLDIGCGNGNYLAFARDAGWQVRGLDFDPAAVAVARAKGLEVLEGTIELLRDEVACYDRITLSHVLEHAYDPWDILAACHRLLKPGGVLWLDTPNMNSSGRAVFGPYWRGLEPPRHVQLFSRACLKDQLLKLGFSDPKDIFSSFATTAMWRESRIILDNAGQRGQISHSRVDRSMAKLRAIFSPESREFITLVCVKMNNES